MSKTDHEIQCPHCKKTFSLDDAGYADILGQVRSVEFELELQERLAQQEKTAEALTKAAVAEARNKAEQSANEASSKFEAAISQLKIELGQASKAKDLAVAEATKDSALREQELKAQLTAASNEKQLALRDLEAEFNSQLKHKDMEINTAKAALEERLRFSRELSTQGIGAEFEQWCEAEFEKIRYMAFPAAEFKKDTTLAEGTKGDYIFRDFINEIEFISIMFEMKNEADNNQKGKKNRDFYSKLDKDRVKKGCEFAILVSTLEPENDVFNKGIHLVHDYEKMLVVRPQFFIEIIGMLRSAAKNSFKEKEQLRNFRQQNIDVTNFEDKLNDFAESFGTSTKHFDTNMGKAIEEIDKSIERLENVKKAIKTALGHLVAASNKVDKLSVRELTKDNPTMQAKFKELE